MAQGKQGGGAVVVIGVLIVVGLVIKIVTFIFEQWRVTLPLAILAVGLWFLVKWLVAFNKWLTEQRELDAQRQVALSARADAQHEEALSGSDNGIYGEFPPVDLDGRDLRAHPARHGVDVRASTVAKPPRWQGIVSGVAVLVGFIGIVASGGWQHSESAVAATSSTTSRTAVYRTTVPTPGLTTSVRAAPTATREPVLVSMPLVLCMNLQAAQDRIQQAGVFYSRSVDATGRGRMQVLDRSWVVVGQTPEPGTLIGEGDAVLSVVKYGEPGDCS